jgi:hypothetical protein
MITKCAGIVWELCPCGEDDQQQSETMMSMMSMMIDKQRRARLP